MSKILSPETFPSDGVDASDVDTNNHRRRTIHDYKDSLVDTVKKPKINVEFDIYLEYIKVLYQTT